MIVKISRKYSCKILYYLNCKFLDTVQLHFLFIEYNTLLSDDLLIQIDALKISNE